MNINPIFYADFYKVGHVIQYPVNTEQVWSNWTPRTSRIHGQTSVVHFGLQYFIKKYLMDEFKHGFFGIDWLDVKAQYVEFMQKTLGVVDPKCDHIQALHELGYLPIDIYSIPEGDSTPLGCPSVVITNTLPEFYWLPNYFETLLSMTLWKPSTSATTAKRLRDICVKKALEFGESDLAFVDWQMHDFSMRGMSGLEDAILSGMGHLLSFSGTDSMPAILAAQEYYGAELTVGGSVPATEHSVMSAGTKEGEFETFKRLISEVYPSGVVSIVSDTWDLWKVLTEYIPRLREEITTREGKVVIRPDSGDPVKIICGDKTSQDWRVQRGAMRLIADAVGTDGAGHISNAGAIYGDSINEDRAEAILSGLIEEGLSPFNMVFGVGSFSYEYKTRDTYGFAMKATAVRRGGEVIPIFKDPVTDDGGKRSHRGIVAVYESEFHPTSRGPCYEWVDGASPEQLDNCSFRKVYSNGLLLIDESFCEIRRRARS